MSHHTRFGFQTSLFPFYPLNPSDVRIVDPPPFFWSSHFQISRSLYSIIEEFLRSSLLIFGLLRWGIDCLLPYLQLSELFPWDSPFLDLSSKDRSKELNRKIWYHVQQKLPFLQFLTFPYTTKFHFLIPLTLRILLLIQPCLGSLQEFQCNPRFCPLGIRTR